ncbi:hypothetical protein KC336_g5753 [Hortaea werneckii]|nr:hypothetical protein KC336_g5753 [Hortaea werneckii]
MSESAGNVDTMDEGGITSNDVQQTNKGAEYFLQVLWMRAQDLSTQLKRYKELPTAKALELSNYRSTIYKAQALAYKEAANAPSDGLRSGWINRAIKLGGLAAAIERFPALSPHALSNDAVQSLFRVVPVEKLVENIREYVATAERLRAAQQEGTPAGPSTNVHDDTTMPSDNGETDAFMAGGFEDNTPGGGRRTPHHLFDERAHQEEDVRMEGLGNRAVEEPDPTNPQASAAREAMNTLMALLQ